MAAATPAMTVMPNAAAMTTFCGQYFLHFIRHTYVCIMYTLSL